MRSTRLPWLPRGPRPYPEPDIHFSLIAKAGRSPCGAPSAGLQISQHSRRKRQCRACKQAIYDRGAPAAARFLGLPVVAAAACEPVVLAQARDFFTAPAGGARLLADIRNLKAPRVADVAPAAALFLSLLDQRHLRLLLARPASGGPICTDPLPMMACKSLKAATRMRKPSPPQARGPARRRRAPADFNPRHATPHGTGQL